MLFEEKVHPSGCSPEPLAIWNKELEDLVLKLLCLFVEVLSKRTQIWLVPGSFCRTVLKWSALRKSFGDVRFFEEKGHSLSVAPEPLAIWNKKLEGLGSSLFENCCLEEVF